ncbi:GH25 family lysozyme, partial [Sporolactobacillus shoreicorticis]
MLGDIEQKKQEAHIWTLKVHAYHFARLTSTEDAKAEADWFAACLKNVGFKASYG